MNEQFSIAEIRLDAKRNYMQPEILALLKAAEAARPVTMEGYVTGAAPIYCVPMALMADLVDALAPFDFSVSADAASEPT